MILTLLAALPVPAAPAGQVVEVVIGPAAPPLEKLAARELAGQLGSLFGARARIGTLLAPGRGPAVLVGSPTTNPAVRAALGARWPRLSDQGHLLRGGALGGRKVLVAGGGSPVATLWAVYELGHRFGMRYLLHGDLLPQRRPPLRLDGIDMVLEPSLRLRAWRTITDFPIGPEAWGLADQRRLFRQLAKLKFNRIVLAVHPWQPYVDFTARGIRKQTAVSWFGYRFPLEGETAGRAAFRGATGLFENPDLAGKNSYEERIRAGTGLARGLIDAAHGLGMSAALSFAPLEFPREFAASLPGAVPARNPVPLSIVPGARQSLDDPALREVAVAQMRAYLEMYPRLDAVYLNVSDHPEWGPHDAEAWRRLGGPDDGSLLSLAAAAAGTPGLAEPGERGMRSLLGSITELAFLRDLLREVPIGSRPDGRPRELRIVKPDPALLPVLARVLPPGAGALHFPENTSRRLAAREGLLETVPTSGAPGSLLVTLSDDNVGTLPQLATASLHRLAERLRSGRWEGFVTRQWTVGEQDPAVYFLARAAFDPRLTPEAAWADLLTPACGEGVAPRLARGFRLTEEATDLVGSGDPGFGFPVPGVMMKHYAAGAAPPAWVTEAKTRYSGAMDEMYRGIQRCSPPARPLLRYYAKRLEFAVFYLAAVEELRHAGAAKALGQRDPQREHLEKAQEALYSSLSAYAEVARDPSDRGVIAVLNEFGYRPIAAELERLSGK